MGYKNTWEITLRLIQLGTEQEELSKQMSKNNDINKQKILEQKMDILDNEFIKLKHKLQEIEI